MAFPTVVARNATLGTTATATPVIDIGSPASGTLVVVLFRSAAGNPVGWPAGWSEIVESTTDAADDATAIAYRYCDGTEGASITLSASNAKFAALAYEITGAENPATQAPQLSTEATGASTTPDPATLTPTGGAKDYLWLWMGGWEGEQTSPPASNPTNYTNPTGANSGTAGVATTNVRVAIAERNLNAASEDPGSWTISVTDDWTAWTMAVHPASTQNLAGVLFDNPPVFNSGTVTASSELTGVLFENASTFPTGTVSVGAVNLDGVLFDNPPVFESGTVTTGYELTGVLYENPPVFAQGAITGGAVVLDGALFVNDPVFLQGEIVGFDRVYPFWSATTDDGWPSSDDGEWPAASELEWQGV